MWSCKPTETKRPGMQLHKPVLICFVQKQMLLLYYPIYKVQAAVPKGEQERACGKSGACSQPHWGELLTTAGYSRILKIRLDVLSFGGQILTFCFTESEWPERPKWIVLRWICSRLPTEASVEGRLGKCLFYGNSKFIWETLWVSIVICILI